MSPYALQAPEVRDVRHAGVVQGLEGLGFRVRILGLRLRDKSMFGDLIL